MKPKFYHIDVTPEDMRDIAEEAAQDTGRLQMLNQITDEFIAKNFPSVNNGHDQRIDDMNAEYIEREKEDAENLQDYYR
jgi:hypothetical protein